MRNVLNLKSVKIITALVLIMLLVMTKLIIQEGGSNVKRGASGGDPGRGA